MTSALARAAAAAAAAVSSVGSREFGWPGIVAEDDGYGDQDGLVGNSRYRFCTVPGLVLIKQGRANK